MGALDQTGTDSDENIDQTTEVDSQDAPRESMISRMAHAPAAVRAMTLGLVGLVGVSAAVIEAAFAAGIAEAQVTPRPPELPVNLRQVTPTAADLEGTTLEEWLQTRYAALRGHYATGDIADAAVSTVVRTDAIEGLHPTSFVDMEAHTSKGDEVTIFFATYVPNGETATIEYLWEQDGEVIKYKKHQKPAKGARYRLSDAKRLTEGTTKFTVKVNGQVSYETEFVVPEQVCTTDTDRERVGKTTTTTTTKVCTDVE